MYSILWELHLIEVAQTYFKNIHLSRVFNIYWRNIYAIGVLYWPFLQYENYLNLYVGHRQDFLYHLHWPQNLNSHLKLMLASSVLHFDVYLIQINYRLRSKICIVHSAWWVLLVLCITSDQQSAICNMNSSNSQIYYKMSMM